MFPESVADTQDLIPEVGQDHVAFDTEEGTILEPTGDTTILLQGIDHTGGPDLVEDHIIEDLFQEADHDQEDEDTMDLGEPYILRHTEVGEADHEQELVAEPLRLSEKEKRELLEIAKANAAKALGADNLVLPASLRVYSLSKETHGGKCKSEDSAESTEHPKD
ncbi:arginine/serine-rich protein 1 isoform X2 [Dermochelys coriacea]|uniref:arginine/serine-rich protein 1 isoform X2 n=1 Tax=Dermochelys coriacea TaxID=27794 RepID=UPI001CA8720D|nr:arginine/serine-rich protein 1 isoform X2 [Dermochelys coriacea]